MTVPMRAEEAASLIVAKAIADAAANPSEMARLEKLQLALVCLSTRVEEANVHFLRALLALEEGDMKRAEEALLLADKLPDIFRGNPPQGPRTPVQELARIHLAKLRQK
jgi:hypothetical protein